MKNRTGPGKSKHILVVDDDLELALTYQALLQVRDYRASTAANGAEALKVVLNGEVDAILCDLNMPGLSGDLFYIAVGRARPHLLKRFIFLTANADNPLYESFLKSIKAPVLSKPTSFACLLEKLQAVLESQAKPSA
ncbi:MAG TPA: response regulator [Bacillota bacterium]|nr:response regulator [Bacillota bacterium]